VQNGEPLSYENITFNFSLFDATEDLKSNLDENVEELIVSLNSVAYADNFLLSEEDQLVSVTVPWSMVEVYDNKFSGDTFASLQSVSELAANTWSEYFGGLTSEEDILAAETLSTKLSQEHEASKIIHQESVETLRGDDIVSCCDIVDNGDDPPYWGNTRCGCYDLGSVHGEPCGDDAHSDISGHITWAVMSITPPHYFYFGFPDCTGLAEIVINLVGEFTGCENQFPHVIAYQFYVVAAYKVDRSRRYPVVGWHDNPLYRRPLHIEGGSFGIASNAHGDNKKIIQMPVKVFDPELLQNGFNPQEYFITVDIQLPHGSNQNHYSQCGMESYGRCNCACPSMSLLNIPVEPQWKVSACQQRSEAHGGEDLGPNDAVGCEHHGSPIWAYEGAECVDRSMPTTDEASWPAYWPRASGYRYENCQHLWKNEKLAHHFFKWYPDTVNNGFDPDWDHDGPLGSDWETGPLTPPSKYTGWSVDYPSGALDDGDDCLYGKDSNYFTCGYRHHLWVRFHDLE